jgi:hypothetical protein
MHDHRYTQSSNEADELVGGAVNALLWTTPYPDPEGGDFNGYLDKDKGLEDVADEDLAKLKSTLLSLFEDDDTSALFDGLSYAVIGHDFILTANRHGAGFWDRGLGERGQRLTELVHPFGEITAFVDEKGQVRIEGLPD